MSTKPKTALVPKWESPEKKKLRFEIRRLEFRLKHGMCDRRERERAETLLADARTAFNTTHHER